jgi:polyphenol oxidase
MHVPPQFRWKLEQGIRLLEVVEWTDSGNVAAYFSTRIGGTSQPPYQSLNLGLHVGDQEQLVIENRQLLSNTVHMPLSHWVAAEQVHGNAVAIIGENEIGRGSLDYETAIPKTDALVTDQSGILLTTYAADCVPILFYSAQGVIAVAHAGWRGTVEKIAARTVQVMCNHFGCEPADIHATIGPSIGPCCYEVDRKVYDAFAVIGLADVCTETKGANPIAGATGTAKSTLEKHWMCDLWSANKRILQEQAKIPESNILLAQQCTSCHNELYFSHRKENGRTGRHIGMIYLK